jgi:PAS domain S-box-containing protein
MNNEQSKRLADILNAMEDGIFIVRQDYTVEFMNTTMIRIFGEGTGRKCWEVVSKENVLCPWCRADSVFTDGETIHSDVYIPSVKRNYHLIELPIRNLDSTVAKLNIYHDITHRKSTEEKLKATEEDYRRLFEHVGVGVYISSKEGKFLNANQALLDMLGYDDKDEFLAMDIKRELYDHPQDREKFQSLIEKVGRVIDYEVNFKHRKGHAVPVMLNSQVRYDRYQKVLGYEGIVVDQTQHLRMQKELKAAHDFLNNVIHSSSNAIMGTDMTGNIIIWNRGAEETLGYLAGEVIGKMNVRELYAEGMAQKVMKMMRSEDYGGRGRLRAYPMNFKNRDGVEVEGSLSASIIYAEDGSEMASVGIFVDLGERLEMERKLSRTQEQLLQSEKLAAMGRLTSQVAHELNNPLYGIMNTLELMKTEISPHNKRRKLLDMALSETVRLTDMLRKMLSFSKPDEEKKCVVDINTIIDEILLLHEKQLREFDIKLHATFADGLGPVFASKNQLRQVFLNMISNAKDAMPEGGSLTVTTEAVNQSVLIKFVDTGVGIREEHLDKIFETFFTTKSDTVKGVGLGLSVCYGFIKDHGGTIKVASHVGEGTEFSIILPIYHGLEEACPVE